MVICTHVLMRKFSERLPTACAYVIKSFFSPWCVCIGVWVHRRWSTKRHRNSMDFCNEGGCIGPYLAAQPTSARVQNRVEFVELPRDMTPNCTAEIQAGTGISRWYHSFQAVVTAHVREYRIRRDARGSPVHYLWIYERVRTHSDVRLSYRCDVRMSYLVPGSITYTSKFIIHIYAY